MSGEQNSAHRLIGDILQEQPNSGRSQNFRQLIIENKLSNDNHQNTGINPGASGSSNAFRTSMKKLSIITGGSAESFGSYRSSSAPPQETLDEPGTPTMSNSNELNLRSNPQYYDYYYSNKNLNPRLPPPIVAPVRRDNFDDVQGHMVVPGSPGAVGDEKKYKTRSVLDQIQQDFPRTPSPVYMLKDGTTTSVQPNQQPLVPEPHHQQHSSHPNNHVVPTTTTKKAGRGYYEPKANHHPRKAPNHHHQHNQQQQVVYAGNHQQQYIPQHHSPEHAFEHVIEYEEDGQQQYMQVNPHAPPYMYNQPEFYQNQRVIVLRPQPNGEQGVYAGPNNNSGIKGGVPPQQGQGPYFNAIPVYVQPHYMMQPNQHVDSNSPNQGIVPPMGGIPQYHNGQYFYPSQMGMQGPPMQGHNYPHLLPNNQHVSTSPVSVGGFAPNTNMQGASPVSVGGASSNSPHTGVNSGSTTPNTKHHQHKERNSDRNHQGDSNHSRKPKDASKNHHGNSHHQQVAEREPTQMSTLMDEFKNGRSGRKFELGDILGHVVEFSRDQHGSRFIQQRLEKATSNEKELVFKEVQPQALSLMTDVFGNYVIQKFFEFGNNHQRKKLAKELQGNVLTLTLQTYGCRVIQKALEVIDNEDKETVVSELKGSVMRCVQDQNGNHVIQKCIERVPPRMIQFIVDGFKGKVLEQAVHTYGCRVIQRILEYCSESQTTQILNEILENILRLVVDPYGNYVVQHVLNHGRPNDKSAIIAALGGHIQELSTNKFASNVIEKCFQQANKKERDLMIDELIGNNFEDVSETPLFTMMKDQFANYVIQKIIETCDDSQRKLITEAVRPHQEKIKKLAFGKHILTTIANYEQL